MFKVGYILVNPINHFYHLHFYIIIYKSEYNFESTQTQGY